MPAHVCYVELFGGSGAVLFAKPHSAYEIYNDLADEVYTFFKALREETEALTAFLEKLPISRRQINEYNEMNPVDLPIIERAARFFYLTMWSYAGKPGKGSLPIRSGYRRDGSIRNVGDGLNYQRKVDLLPNFAERLRPVVIENQDFKKIIKKYDGENTFFYCDPPYLGLNHYLVPFKLVHHFQLRDEVTAIAGKVMLSYYEHPQLKVLYPPEEWFYVDKEVTVQVAKEKKLKIHQKTREVLIMNYDPATDKFNSNQTSLEGFI